MEGMIQVIDKPCSRYLALLGHQAVRLAVAPCICTYRYPTAGLGLGPSQPPAVVLDFHANQHGSS
ncbi:hypothetical protein N7509_008645 [Penicillium cosmopolitanum]|uniref:Uncharacterized protein n=1 Tax=Penicillium cosmopolitanum TaxID=1131564 RepID=A0A9X0B2V2_9EURO|nr:uncharacterized protein N7509_008645 [Penicillium cosmopolitanum]KAJ5386104.1 hypothetical protein N7509_008645 [Penicillium cosmopolitanum]